MLNGPCLPEWAVMTIRADLQKRDVLLHDEVAVVGCRPGWMQLMNPLFPADNAVEVAKTQSRMGYQLE